MSRPDEVAIMPDYGYINDFENNVRYVSVIAWRRVQYGEYFRYDSTFLFLEPF